MDYIMETLSKVETNREVIPEGCLSFSEMSDYLAEFTNSEFNKLLESIGINELIVYEATGSMIVYEGKLLSDLKAKFANHIKDTWSAYKGFWEKALKQAQEDVNGAKSIGDLSGSIDYLKADKIYGKTHSFYDQSTIKFGTNTREFIKEINNSFEGAEDGKKIKSELESKVCSKISGVDAKLNMVMKKALKKKLTGNKIDMNGAQIKKEWNNIRSEISTGYISNVKKAYNTEKEVFAIATKRLESIDDSFTNVINSWMSIINTALHVMHGCYATQLDVDRRQFREYVNIATKVVSLDPSKKLTESVVEEDEVQVSEVTTEDTTQVNLENSSEDDSSVTEDIKEPFTESFFESKQFDLIDRAFDF